MSEYEWVIPSNLLLLLLGVCWNSLRQPWYWPKELGTIIFEVKELEPQGAVPRSCFPLSERSATKRKVRIAQPEPADF